MKVKSLSRIGLLATPWTAAYQAPPSMGFSRQEYWSRVPSPAPGDLPSAVTELESPALAGRFFTSEIPGKPPFESRQKQKMGYEETLQRFPPAGLYVGGGHS